MFKSLAATASSILLLIYSKLELAYWQAFAGAEKEAMSQRPSRPITKTISRIIFLYFITLGFGTLRFDFLKVTFSSIGSVNRSIKQPILGISGQSIDERQFKSIVRLKEKPKRIIFIPMKEINTEDYRIKGHVQLSEIPTHEDFGESDKKLKKELKNIRKDLGDFQDTLYAHGKYGVLVCLQGIDTAGKDSLIREVFKDFNARGVEVHSFKVPSAKEKKHDYLWRHYIALPERGKFSVFNRTHYENVLVTKVHPEYILGENIPKVDSVDDIDEGFWEKRYQQINDFERHIAENGTIIFKFFLHLSKEEQRQRLLRRIRLKRKNWKFSPGDLEERKLWDKYITCYEEALNKTSKEYAPWFVIPADNKKAARVIVASIMMEALKKYKDIEEPELDDEIKANLESFKQELEKETR